MSVVGETRAGTRADTNSRRGTCVVTGGAGFIGCAISGGLVSRYEKVFALDNLHQQIHPARHRPDGLHPGVELVQGDVTEQQDWLHLLHAVRPELVIHLAAETGTGQSLTEATRHSQVNVVGTATMLDAMAASGVIPKRMILTSSRAVYGEGAWRSVHDGEITYPGQRTRDQLARAQWDFEGFEPVPANGSVTRAAPVSIYGATKLSQEHMMAAWCAAFGNELTILRLQNVYGPGQSLSNPYTGIVPLFCRLARSCGSIPLYEDGRMLRDFVFIEDVADAILRAEASATAPQYPIDIGTGAMMSIADLAASVARIYGAPIPHVDGKYRFGDVRHASCVNEPAKKQFDWVPKHGIDEGLLKLTQWIENELVRV